MVAVDMEQTELSSLVASSTSNLLIESFFLRMAMAGSFSFLTDKSEGFTSLSLGFHLREFSHDE